MSKIQPTAFAPVSIDTIRFRIPLYQRPYTWQVLQVEQLLKDLYHQFEEDSNGKYYIGILNVGTTEQKDVYDLIDGQQRITTLCLIAGVLKSSYTKWNDFLSNRLNLYGRTEDQTFLENHISSSKTNPRMTEAVDAINKFIKEKIHEKSEDFSKYVYENASFFISKVPDHYSLIDKNLQFVRMNNRGKQLEAHDVLKIKLSVKIIDETKRNEFIIKWNEFSQLGCAKTEDKLVGKQKVLDLLKPIHVYDQVEKDSQLFYESIVSYAEFLLIALARFFKKENAGIEVSQTKERWVEESQKHKLLEEFGFGEKKVDFDWSETNVNAFGTFLCKQFSLFDNYIIKRDKDEKYKFNGDIERFIGDSLLELQVFQSFLFVTREPNQSNWLIDTFNYLDELKIADHKINTSEFLSQLKKLDNDRCKTRNLESLNYGSIDRYWFWRLDYYLWERRTELFLDTESIEIAKKYVFKANRSIEHIAPQNPKSQTIVKIKDEMKDTFGNLVMISSGQNSSLQNETFEVKRAHVESFIKGSKGGTIESLKMLCVYKMDGWNDKQIELHSEKMMKVLIESFPQDEYLEIRTKLEQKPKTNDNAITNQRTGA